MILLLIYIIASAIVTYVIYKEQTPFYAPIYVAKKPKNEGEVEEKVNIQDEFPEFSKSDKPVNVTKLFIGVLTLFWIRFIINLILVIVLSKKVSGRNKEKNNKLEKEDIDYITNYAKYIGKWFLRVAGLIVDNKRLPDEKILPVYQKYFGPEYKINYDQKFGCLISNHSCIYDMVCAISHYGNGFVAKEAVKHVPFFGKLMTGLQTIFVDRQSTGSKNDTLEKLSERQKAYYNGEPVMPFMIFPEGTTTNGSYLITFKKGAFATLLPIKPTILHPNITSYHLGSGSSDVTINYLRSLSQLYTRLEYIELPIMTPNEYMFKNFESYGKEKWEIYAAVAREIMSILGNLKISDKGIKESYRYTSSLKEKKLLDKETYKIRE